MAEDAEKAKQYRLRADQLASQATGLEGNLRRGVLQVIDTYRTIADSLDQIEASKRALGLLND